MTEASQGSYKGFTLIELMIAITIVAVLSITGYTAYNQSQIRGRDVKRKKDLQNISTALEIFYQQNRRYPCTGTTAPQNQTSLGVNWIVDRNSAATPCTGNNTNLSPNFIRDMPVDPLNSGNFYYQYQSSGANYGSTCRGGQYYFLIARLENANDADLYSKKPFDICGANPVSWCNDSTCMYYVVASD